MNDHRNSLADPDDPAMYDRVFWLSFIANVLLVSANALTFRFAEFINFLGGTEETTGRIVSVGLLGSLFLRAFLGQALDYFGIRRVWITSGFVYLLGCFLILTATDVGPQIYIARVTFVIGIASMFASSVSHIQGRAPLGRRTEMIATFGSSGFLGMICGTQAGDLIFHYIPDGEWLYRVLFGTTFVLGIFYTILAATLTAQEKHLRPTVTPAVHRLMFRYWPPLILIVTCMMGLTFAVTMTFLTRYATFLQLSGIRTFFTAYAISAFGMRMLSSTWSRHLGRHRLIVLGLAGQGIGQFLLSLVHADWQFIPAGVLCGMGHALLFPCVVSLGTSAFPEQYRGTGTAVTLAAIDLGTIFTAPFLGWIIDNHGFHPMFYTASGILLTSSLLYYAITASIEDADVVHHRQVLQSRRAALEAEDLKQEVCTSSAS